jgi:hypothetical protein
MRRALFYVPAVVAVVGVLAGWLARVPARDSAFFPFPPERDCAVAITDDTDGFQFATVDPVYALLDSLGLRVTKTVWVFDHAGADAATVGPSLEDPAYRTWVARRADAGHEIALHSPSCGDDDRNAVLLAHDRLERTLGVRPRIETFHGRNREALYRGGRRAPSAPGAGACGAAGGGPASEGHVLESEFYWLDEARRLVRYVRSYTTGGVNTLALNPSMPYEDPTTPLAPLWFASSDGRSGDRFVELLSRENIARLKAERGAAVVRTQSANGFTSGAVAGRPAVSPDVREALLRCGTDAGIEFVPTGELLDRLRVIQLVERLLAEAPEAAPSGGTDAGEVLHLTLPRELLPALGGISVDPGRLGGRFRRVGPPEEGRVGLLPWLARARIATDIAPSTVFEGARRIGWRERWRLAIRSAAARAGCAT